VDLATGEPRWTFDTHGSAWPTPAVTSDAVFIGAVGVADYWAGHQGAFLAVDRSTGAPRWQYPLERSGTASTWGFAASPTTAGELVFTADLGGTVYAFRQSG
jgi:outer membrane protein assembly factor BamB